MADRNIRDVIAQLLKVIPTDQTTLISRLKSLDSGSTYCPPECVGELWAACHHILVEEVGKPELDWEIQVENIFSNRKCWYCGTSKPVGKNWVSVGNVTVPRLSCGGPDCVAF